MPEMTNPILIKFWITLLGKMLMKPEPNFELLQLLCQDFIANAGREVAPNWIAAIANGNPAHASGVIEYARMEKADLEFSHE